MTVQSMNSLKGKSWANLQQIAIEVGVPLDKVREAPTRDSLRLLILEKSVERA